jgi:hypothetical protein
MLHLSVLGKLLKTMKTILLMAALMTTSLLLATGCSTCHCSKPAAAGATAACDGSCCSNSVTCTKCCGDAAGCAKCCKKS